MQNHLKSAQNRNVGVAMNFRIYTYVNLNGWQYWLYFGEYFTFGFMGGFSENLLSSLSTHWIFNNLIAYLKHSEVFIHI